MMAGVIRGDGVNVAARLEALAEPGGVCVSRAVRDQIRDKLQFAFDDLGEFQVKNIARPVRVFAFHTVGLARERKQERRPDIFENVPARVLNFTGREPILAELNKLLIQDYGNARSIQVAIHGLGGVGKTSLAAEYAHRHASQFAGVWWAPAENRTLLINSLAAFAGQLVPSLAQEVDQERAARAGLAHISRSLKPYLLIFDNVDTPDVLRDLVPAAGARLLITTRWADWGGRSAELPLHGLRPESAVELLQKRAERKDPAGAARLAAALGHLPLALDHAGAYCRLTGTGFDGYLEKIDRLLGRPPSWRASQQARASHVLRRERSMIGHHILLLGLIAVVLQRSCWRSACVRLLAQNRSASEASPAKYAEVSEAKRCRIGWGKRSWERQAAPVA